MKKIPSGLYKIFWYSGGIVKEEVFQNVPVPWPIAQAKKRIMEQTTHRTGAVKVVPADEIPNQHQLKFKEQFKLTS